MEKFYLIFTDLDGTLLDHDSYDYRDAMEALDYIRGRQIPLVICSSKTRLEVELYRKQLGLKDPFIVENGAAIFIEKGSMDLQDMAFTENHGYPVIELGVPYSKIKSSWAEIRAETGLEILGLSEMSPAKIAEVTGLSVSAAELACRREYSEPFLFMEKEGKLVHLENAAQKRGLKITRGGRFYHLIGDFDKGRAVRMVKKLYEREGRILVSIGLGDSVNDFAMLENVEIAILIKKKTGEYETWAGSKKVLLAPDIGPKGWNKAVLKVLKGGTSWAIFSRTVS